jgi:sec-independent protein translocase protein TatA
MPGWISPWELLILLLVVLLVFGPKRLPEMGRSLGKGMREFKSSIQGKDDDDRQALPAPTTTSTPSHDEPVSSRDRDSVV